MKNPIFFKDIISRTATLLFLTLFSGCALFQSGDLSSTQKGAIAGSVVGAGLGTVIGATSGNAGEGLLIGSAAGAVVGGIAGRTVDNQEAENQRVAQNVQLQEQQIAKQNQQIGSLRSSLGDNASASQINSNRPGGPTWKNDSYNSNSYALQANAVVASNSGSSSSQRGFANNPEFEAISVDQLASTKPVSQEETYPTNVSNMPQAQGFGASIGTPVVVQEDKVVEEVASDAPSIPVDLPPVQEASSSQLPPAKKVEAEIPSITSIEKEAPKVEEKTAEVTEKKVEEKKLAMLARDQEMPTTPKVVEEVKQEVPKVEEKAVEPVQEKEEEPVAKNVTERPKANIDCDKAKLEIDRAENASSDADRLFYYRRALRLCPTNSELHVRMGEVFNSIGRTEDAAFEFRQAIDLDPNNANAREGLSLLETQ
jgi:tetratricopeptide (TPR) repeat protein